MSTDFLFARPSFLSGFARTLDLGGQFDEYNQSRTPAEADRRALRSDWAMTGEDIARAVAEYGVPQDGEPRQPVLPWAESELAKAR